MNRRQKIIVSVVGIFIVLLALVGITYGYFLTRIHGNTNTSSITVTTADLKLVYGDGNGDIVAENILPGEDIDTKTFTVFNDGNQTVSNYNVYLENVVNTFTNKEEVVYTLECESDDEEHSPCTNEILEETVYPSVNGVLLTNTLAVGDTHTYTLTVKYKETNTDQSIDMNKVLNGKINIYDINSLKTLTLGNYILSNGALVELAELDEEENPVLTGELMYDKEYTEKTIISKVADGTDSKEIGLFTAEDDYGKSYYFRGTVKNNYVNFAGFIWRIVRINGDGSIRLILNGTTNKVKREGLDVVAGTSSFFKEFPAEDNAYVGYMHGLEEITTAAERCLVLENGIVTDKVTETGYTTKTECENKGGKWATTAYEATHANVGDSTIKDAVDLFYETYIENAESNYHYGEYLKDTIFCGDKTLASDGIAGVEKQLGYGNNSTYYAVADRIYYSDGNTTRTELEPTLKCASGATNDYSRYTVEKNTINVETNGDLTYPIALLSADELVLAGAYKTEKNNVYYMSDEFDKGMINSVWGMMTPYRAESNAYTFRGYAASRSIHYGIVDLTALGVRPVINLKANLVVESGDGTSSGPYKVKFAD